MSAEVLALNIESETTKRCRRPWLAFAVVSLLAVLLLTSSETIFSFIRVSTAAPPRRRAAAEYKLIHHASASAPPPPAAAAAATTTSPPPPSPPPPPPPPSETRTVDAKGAVDPGGAQRVGERSPLIQGMIEAGFSRAQAEEALAATGAKEVSDVPKAIEWSMKKGAEKNKLEATLPRDIHTFDKMDFDGYAVVWGDKHRARTLEECGAKCLAWKPLPPAHYACNVFVYCPLDKCYAPAALPPGSMTGQCWLKHQEDPNNPQVNMRG